MGDKSDGDRRKLHTASRLYACSEGAMKLNDTMKVDGYTKPDRKGGDCVPKSLSRRHEYIEGDKKGSGCATNRGSK